MRALLFYAPGLLLAFGIALSACPGGPGGEGEGEDGGVVVEDGGVVDGGPSGEGEGAAGEGEGEGGFQFCDGGLCPDSGVQGQEYVGAPEDGVKCQDTTCNVGDDCCVSADFSGTITGTCSGGNPCQQTGILNADEHCDGAEDCTAGQECCIDSQYSATCVTAGTCESDGNHSTVCVTTSDCAITELCCGLAAGSFQLPVDMGVCAPAENNCQVQ